MEWTTACPDWRGRIVERRSIIPAPLFPDEAEAALEVFRGLRIVDAPGKPTFGEACEEWVFEFVAAIFGAYDAGRAKRMIREFFLLISKKNSKSTIAAGIMVTALIRNWRHSAELLILAPTIEVANNAFHPARDMIREDPELDFTQGGFLHIQEHTRTITHKTTGATLKVVAADSDTVSGKKAAFVLIDELWIFGKRPKADAMLREATGGQVARPEGFVIILSTQSDEEPAGVFKAKLDYYREVRDGKRKDPRSLPVLYEFPKEMVEAGAYNDPENFYVTNPNIGRSVDLEWLIDEHEKVQGATDGALQVFLAKHLNVEIGLRLAANRWPGAEYWERRAAGELTDLKELLARCEVITIGIDGGGLDDLFGLCVLGREKGTKRWLAWSRAWAHSGVLKRRPLIASKLRDLEREGTLRIVGDSLEDLTEIVGIVKAVLDAGLLGGVGVDPAGLGEFVDEMDAIEVTQDAGLLMGVPQGIRLMDAMKTAERKLANGTLLHGGTLLMNWCVGNVKVEPMATAIRATKRTAGDAKIDPAIALFNAVFVMQTNPEPVNLRSVYEDRGILTA
ncbi:terminase [Methylopila jiangsuensis]|uniref:Terminase n=1 Tax=Methylopila jiangsuensis TaxID=586230 RepID=A0A9W6JKY3_9HYPH|nr:terminase large subunit [Methylopila jiangsuensis]MDR6284582.1 phage terminase large subunit-like protein [Methylopila jiangsuensis]GLK78029.1 terminase [Methylopila jiangsuensis]